MRRSASVLLRHESRGGVHYDWMMEDPRAAAGAGALLTWRVTLPNEQWAAAGVVELLRIADHRRAYLRREGRLTGDRGWVRRVDAGGVIVRNWHEGGAVLTLELGRVRGEAELRRIGGARFLLRLRR